MSNPDIPFARPFIGKEEEAAVLRVLRSGWLTTGSEALAFEKEFAAFLSPAPGGSPSNENVSVNNKPANTAGGLFCLAVNSATSGLHLALEACGVGQGDIVLVPSCTFTATAEVARYLGADPVFVDVTPGTFHIDPNALEDTVKRLPKAKAVIPVHYGGLPCDMAAIMAIARRYNLKVIEDSAHAFPSAGTIGDAGVFSFYATKTITTGEGGMVVCRDGEIARRISLMRSHGIDRTIWNRYSDTRASWYYEAVEAGYKYNMPDLLAAVGRVQLSRARELLRQREAIAAAYDAAFAGDERFILPPTGPGDARHLYPLRLDPLKVNVSRDTCIEKLKEAGIGVSVHFIPLHTMPYYKNRYSLAETDFPETMKSYKQEISLPIWPGMTKAQVQRVIDEIKRICKNTTR
jgi:dTDP-4-amino-4,6-dideoxygalactose transaminase